MKPVIALTIGDYNGIGPEVVLKSVLRPEIRRLCTPVLVGSAEAFEWTARRVKLRITLQAGPRAGEPAPGTVNVIDPSPATPVRVVPCAP